MSMFVLEVVVKSIEMFTFHVKNLRQNIFFLSYFQRKQQKFSTIMKLKVK